MIDPVVVLIVVAGLAPWRWSRGPTTRMTRGALLLLAGYLLFTVAVRDAVDARWRQALARDGLMPVRAAVVPAFPGPWRWLGVAETEDGAVRARFWAWVVTTASRTVAAFLDRAKVPWRRVIRDGETSGRDRWPDSLVLRTNPSVTIAPITRRCRQDPRGRCHQFSARSGRRPGKRHKDGPPASAAMAVAGTSASATATAKITTNNGARPRGETLEQGDDVGQELE